MPTPTPSVYSVDMSILDDIATAWGWTGLRPVKLALQNDFGNLIVEAEDGRFWRICPENPDCIVVADDSMVFERLRDDPSFNIDWSMRRPTTIAQRKLGLLSPGRCYCAKIPLILGGTLETENLDTIEISELIRFSGYLAEQVDRLEDGAQIVLDTSKRS